MPETWRQIEEFDCYRVSNLGRVQSIDRTDTLSRSLTGTILQINKTGPKRNYATVHLYADGVRFARKVHQLVLDAFVGPCPDGLEVRHLNGNSLDNRLENLKYGTSVENAADKLRHGTHPSQLPKPTHCPRGHEYTPDNIYRRPSNPAMRCLTCKRSEHIRARARAAAKS